ncbi:multiple epidermal growth factor-like domains protein 10 [Saccostrea cucullata]|uniref:multiple epidermal growth factor-like domains protein 10 n=1 Tax=Saccostrea cuccullata TaxID=36930 RepID=UPI002ED61199
MILLLIYEIALVVWCASSYENVAFSKPTWQSQQYNPGNALFNSSNAVDGKKSNLKAWGGECVISAARYRTATWWVNLESVYSIHDIRIYYRTDNAVWDATNGYTRRFLGFYVYVSNTTNRLEGYLCFHDTNYTRATIPSIANITCPVHGQYVIYFNERLRGTSYPSGYSIYAFNELCEVEVYGCIPGFYGLDCFIPCPENCRYCHIETGVCSWCKPGYQGYQCENECDGGRYGQDCGRICRTCLENTQCNYINGSCLEGCDAGYEGTLCDSECSAEYFGYNCENKCNDNCGVPNKCNKTTGECEGGCQAGWKGLLCSEQCDDNRYGQDCGQICGACLGYKQCHYINGSCLEGCDAGYEGNLCTMGCSTGKFEKDCSENCSVNCVVATVCHSVTGECPNGCQPGWEGNHCERLQVEDKENCHPSFYGILGAFLVSVTANVVFIAYILLKRKNEKRMTEPTIEEKFNNEKRKPSDIYENSDKNVTGDYLELGELENHSHYDALQ